MDIFWKIKERKGKLYSVRVCFKPFDLAFLPMVLFEMLCDNGFKLTVGFLTFFIEVSKVQKMSEEELNGIFDDLKGSFN